MLTLLLFSMLIPSVWSQQDVPVSEVEESLQSWFTWFDSYITEDGQVTSNLGAQNTIRATALLGQIVIGIHVGLLDSNSLLLLNRIANYLNTQIPQKIQNSESPPTGDDVLTMGAISDFLAGHYALTNSDQSRENLLQITDFFVQELGWSLLNSRLFVLTNTFRVEQLTQGLISKQDVEEAINDLLDHQIDFVDYSLLDPINFPICLNVLSALYDAALEAQVSVPSEVIAFWEVYRNYTLTDLPILPRTPSFYSINLQYLSSLIEALDVSNDPQTLEMAQNLAQDLLDIWQSGDRLIRQPFSPYEVYPHDPAIEFDQISQDALNGVTILKVDLKLANLLDRLADQDPLDVGLYDEFKSKTDFALNKVLVNQDYYPIFESKTLPTEGFVDRMENVAFVSEWLARSRLQEQVPSEILAFQPQNVPISLIAAAIILIAVGLLYNRGILFPKKEED